jgi:hypothetical protein
MAFALHERFLADTESKLGARLPESYRVRMKKANGGELVLGEETWYLHPILDTTDRKRTSRTSNDVLRETASIKAWPEFPSQGVAIANNGEGDMLVFLVDAAAGKVEEPVYLWRHEGGELEKVAEFFAEIGGLPAE